MKREWCCTTAQGCCTAAAAIPLPLYRCCRCAGVCIVAARLFLHFRGNVVLCRPVVLPSCPWNCTAFEMIMGPFLVPTVVRQESWHTRIHKEAPFVAVTKGRPWCVLLLYHGCRKVEGLRAGWIFDTAAAERIAEI